MSTQKSGIYECIKGTYLHNAVAGIRARGEVHSVTLEAHGFCFVTGRKLEKIFVVKLLLV